MLNGRTMERYTVTTTNIVRLIYGHMMKNTVFQSIIYLLTMNLARQFLFVPAVGMRLVG